MRTLFKNAAIVTCNDTSEIIREGYLGVDGATICYLGKDRPTESYDTEKDMAGKLLMPGLVNGHTHTSMNLLRGAGSDLPLKQWLDTVNPIEDRMDEEDIRVGTQAALLEMIASGITSFSDMYIFPEIAIEETSKAGMKANITRPLLSFQDGPVEENFRALESIRLFQQYHNSSEERIKIDFSIHAEYTSTPLVVREYGQICKDMKGNMHLHLSETEREHQECIERWGKTPARWFYDLGVFDSPTQAAHCVMVTEEDMDLLKEKEVTIIHNPTSNMKLGSGFAPLKRMVEKGISVALGTDGAASNNNLNLLEEMHLAAVIHKGKERDPQLLSPSRILAFATRNGAVMQGRKDTGELKVGNRADIIAVSMDKPHMVPNKELESLLVYSAQASDVWMTMVDGTLLYENGIYFTLDAEKVMKEFAKRASCLW